MVECTTDTVARPVPSTHDGVGRIYKSGIELKRDNSLDSGRVRIGCMADGDETTPHVATLLRNDGERIELTVPWLEHRSPYERWFFGDVTWGDDPERKLYRYSVPDLIHFVDPAGDVALVGPRFRSARGLGVGTGEGIASFDYAILGAQGRDFRRINGLRTYIPGMGEWTRLRSVQIDQTTDDVGMLRSTTLSLDSPPRITLDRRLNTTLVPHYRYASGDAADLTEVRERVLLETRLRDPRPWSEHKERHQAILNLLEIAAWRRLGFTETQALRDDNPFRVMSGDSIGEQWCNVESFEFRKPHDESPRLRFLFGWNDLGALGVKRWLKLRREFARALDPALSYFAHPEMPLEPHFIQLQIGLEALAYLLALDSGESKTSARRQDHIGRLRRIAGQVSSDLPFEAGKWAERTSRCYNGYKHANKDVPEFSDIVLSFAQSWLLLRLWVAERIGVDVQLLNKYSKLDPLWATAACESLS